MFFPKNDLSRQKPYNKNYSDSEENGLGATLKNMVSGIKKIRIE